MTGPPFTFAAVAQPLAKQGWRPFPGYQASKTPAMLGWPGLNGAEWDDADLVAAVGDYQPDDLFCCCLAAQPEIVAIDLDIAILPVVATAIRRLVLGLPFFLSCPHHHSTPLSHSNSTRWPE